MEICEHKGVGHPDSIVDGVCEAASRALSLAYFRNAGTVEHHNLDKGLLIAGRSAPRFRGGTLLSPIRLVISGRATPIAIGPPVSELAIAAARQYLLDHLRCGLGYFELEAAIREGSGNLREVFRRGCQPLANDSSVGSGFAPYSRLERTVLALADILKSPEFRGAFPMAGDDFKILGVRRHEKIRLTMALAFIDRYIEGVDHYFTLKQAMQNYFTSRLGQISAIHINALDNPVAQDENGLYLTVTGMSAEMGDDGQAGRGNRVCGLITPGRGMSLEGVAGKNPVAHVGKLYNVLAHCLARTLQEEMEALEMNVRLVSTIGDPIARPELIWIEGALLKGWNGARRRHARVLASQWLARTDEISALIVEGHIPLF